MALSGAGGGNYFNYNFNGKSGDFYEKEKIMEFLAQNLHWIIAGILVILVLCAIFMVFGVLGRGALISSIEKRNAGEPSNFKLGLKESRKYFWKIFLISLAIGIFIFSTMVVLIVPITLLFLNHNYFIGAFMLGLAGLILIPLIILSVYIKIYGYIYIVLGKLSFISAIESAYNLFRKNVSASLIMGLLFIPINIILAIIMVAAAIPLAIVFLGMGLIAFLVAGKIGALVIAAIALLVFLVVVFFIKSVYAVFAQSVWIFFFYEIAKVKNEDVVINLASNPVDVATKTMPVIETRED